MLPIHNGTVTCQYGTQGDWWAGGRHRGIDYGASVGTPVLAPWSGRCVSIGRWGQVYGRYAPVIDFDRLPDGRAGLWGVIGHMMTCHLRVGDRVIAGQEIGHVGMEGLSHGPHVHFEVQASPWWTPPALHLARDPRPWCRAQPPAGIAHNE